VKSAACGFALDRKRQPNIMIRQSLLIVLVPFFTVGALRADPPVGSYIFPAGGQRGTAVNVRVGGLFLHSQCGFEMLGAGIKAPATLKRTRTVWFEGSLLPLPDSQRQEDYPKDMAGQVQIDKDAAVGTRYWRVWTSQGAAASMKLMIGDLPEVVEDEIDGDPVPVPVTLPVTVNGRIFPREDVDIWSFHATKGQPVYCEVRAARLGSPLDARLEVRDPQGRRLAESHGRGPDPILRFTAPADGDYQVHIHDVRFHGGQAYVYRLTITADPHVDYFYPLGGKRGSSIRLEATGQGLTGAPVEVALPAGSASELLHRIVVAGKQTNEILLELDDLPEYLEAEPNDEPGRAQSVAVPAVLNGRIDRPGDVDCWTWSGHKGAKLAFDLRAGRLGSPLDGVVSIHDASGKELLRAENSGNQLDPMGEFIVPADGVYQVRVRDRFRSRGGPEYAYRLRVAAPRAPDFGLRLSTDAVTLPRTGQASIKVTAERQGGFKEPIELVVDGLPPGVSVAGTKLAAGQSVADLQLKAAASAAIKVSHLTIRGTAKAGNTSRTRAARLNVPRGEPDLESVLLAVALPTPFKIKGEYIMGFAPRGTIHKRLYKIERGGFTGPIEVSLADRQARHLQGAAGPAIVVPPAANEFTYSALLPPWMETGRTCRVCVMGVGVIQEPDASKHEVSFSSVNQNEQLVAVVGPGRLAMDLARTSITAVPGGTIPLPLHIRRGQGLSGIVKIELLTPAHMHGLSADAVTIPADREDARLTIRCASGPLGPFNMPVTIRAALVHNREPVIAESKLEISSP
jgi:hypothetical protein